MSPRSRSGFSTFRLAITLVVALAAALSLNMASAQMMHFNLDITIQTEDGSDIPAGQVCVSSVTGGETCMDVGGNPSGRDFFFSGLADGEHTVTINAGNYLEIVDTVTLTEETTSVPYTLQHEVTPPADDGSGGAPAEVLPATGTGAAVGSEAPMALVLLAGSLLLGLMSLAVSRRRAI
jgi:hypothetical protein